MNRFGNRLRSIFKLPAVTNARVEKMKSFEDGDGAVNMTERSFGSVNVKKENPTF